MYYNTNSEPIERDEWSKLFQKRFSDPEFKWIVGQDRVGNIDVSTVWIGLDHSLGDGKPKIFESMCFTTDAKAVDGLPVVRYSTWQEAEEGHREIVEQIKKLQPKKDEAWAKQQLEKQRAYQRKL